MKRKSDEQIREEFVRRLAGGRDPTEADYHTARRFLTALMDTVGSNPRFSFYGLGGVFRWVPCRGTLPTGKKYSSWRLLFTMEGRSRVRGLWERNKGKWSGR